MNEVRAICSKGKEFILNHLGLSAEKGRTELLEIKDPDGNPISIDELINMLYTPSLADNVKKAISRTKREEYVLPKLFPKLFLKDFGEISLKDKLRVILGVLIDLERETGMAKKSVVIEVLEEKYGIGLAEAERLIGQLVKEGTVYTPREGYLKKT